MEVIAAFFTDVIAVQVAGGRYVEGEARMLTWFPLRLIRTTGGTMNQDQAAITGRGLSPAYHRRPQLRQTNCMMETPVCMSTARSGQRNPSHLQHRMRSLFLVLEGMGLSFMSLSYATTTEWSTRETATGSHLLGKPLEAKGITNSW